MSFPVVANLGRVILDNEEVIRGLRCLQFEIGVLIQCSMSSMFCTE